jgi:hypothetical protein
MAKMSRRAFGSQITRAAALAGALFGASAGAQIVWNREEWKVATFNELLAAKGEVRQLFDITAATSSLDKVKNSLNGLQVGFGIPATEIRIVAGLHGAANLLNFDDSIWNKYKVGAWLGITDPDTGKPALRNPFYKSPFRTTDLAGDPNDLKSPWHDASVEGLQRRGVQFLGCHTALEFQVRELVKRESLTAAPEMIVREMLDHLQPGSLMVVAMVAAMALLQGKGQYSYVKL